MKIIAFGTNCKATITSPAWNFPMKKKEKLVYGEMRHLNYLKQHRKATYNRLQAEFKLNSYLYDINSQAEEMFETLINQFKQTEGITEQLKSENQMEWVRRINNIRQMATEIVISELIYNWNTKMSEA